LESYSRFFPTQRSWWSCVWHETYKTSWWFAISRQSWLKHGLFPPQSHRKRD
jgi:hypothetical protein